MDRTVFNYKKCYTFVPFSSRIGNDSQFIISVYGNYGYQNMQTLSLRIIM
jgi:hypothetical protein